MGPGPSNPYPEATLALGQPMLGHLDPLFLEILDETCDRLRTVFQSANALTLPISGTGSAGMEALFVNLLHPGDVAVVGVNGLLGERMVEVAARAGGTVVRVDAPWGKALDPAAVAGGIPLQIDDWGIDAAYSGTQKCLGVAPGLAPLTMSPGAFDRRVAKPQSWYLDLGMIGDYAASKARKYHHTAPVPMVMSLHAGLGALLDEGLEASFARHAECGRLLAAGLEALDLQLWADPDCRLPQLTTVFVPDGVDSAEVRARLLGEFGIEIGAGVGEWSTHIWRIGCMGNTARRANVTLLLAALSEVLGRSSLSRRARD